MKGKNLFPLLLLLFFSFCTKKESDSIQPINIEKHLIGSWKEVETTVKEFDTNNNLLKTTPNISPTSEGRVSKRLATCTSLVAAGCACLVYKQLYMYASGEDCKIQRKTCLSIMAIEWDSRTVELPSQWHA